MSTCPSSSPALQNHGTALASSHDTDTVSSPHASAFSSASTASQATPRLGSFPPRSPFASAGPVAYNEAPPPVLSRANHASMHPSGPRGIGVGVEEERQGIVHADTDDITGSVILHVTLLASGFIIGPGGSSIREICKKTTADIRSWTEQRATPRPVRVFVVSGSRPCVGQAVDIICDAVERYKDLCEGGHAGRAVSRIQHVRGIDFVYQPPPRSAMPQAAALKGMYVPRYRPSRNAMLPTTKISKLMVSRAGSAPLVGVEPPVGGGVAATGLTGNAAGLAGTASGLQHANSLDHALATAQPTTMHLASMLGSQAGAAAALRDLACHATSSTTTPMPPTTSTTLLQSILNASSSNVSNLFVPPTPANTLEGSLPLPQDLFASSFHQHQMHSTHPITTTSPAALGGLLAMSPSDGVLQEDVLPTTGGNMFGLTDSCFLGGSTPEEDGHLLGQWLSGVLLDDNQGGGGGHGRVHGGINIADTSASLQAPGRGDDQGRKGGVLASRSLSAPVAVVIGAEGGVGRDKTSWWLEREG